MRGEVFPSRLKVLIELYRITDWCSACRLRDFVKSNLQTDLCEETVRIILERLVAERLVQKKFINGKRGRQGKLNCLYRVTYKTQEQLSVTGILQKEPNSRYSVLDPAN